MVRWFKFCPHTFFDGEWIPMVIVIRMDLVNIISLWKSLWKITLPKTNIAPETSWNNGIQKETGLPTINFQVLLVSGKTNILNPQVVNRWLDPFISVKIVRWKMVRVFSFCCSKKTISLRWNHGIMGFSKANVLVSAITMTKIQSRPVCRFEGGKIEGDDSLAAC